MIDDYDDEWRPEPWGWRGLTTAAAVILALAIVLYYFGVFTPKPTTMRVAQFNIPSTIAYCHPARFYFDGNGWHCAK